MVSETMQQTEAARRPTFTLPGRLRAAREDAGMTQTAAAKVMKRPQSFMSKLETGEREPRFREVVLLARLYERDVVYFSVVVE